MIKQIIKVFTIGCLILLLGYTIPSVHLCILGGGILGICFTVLLITSMDKK